MYKEQIFNGITGETTWRDYTPEEIIVVEQAKSEAQRKAQDLAARENARQSALNKLIDLGLTEEEIAAL